MFTRSNVSRTTVDDRMTCWWMDGGWVGGGGGGGGVGHVLLNGWWMVRWWWWWGGSRIVEWGCGDVLLTNLRWHLHTPPNPTCSRWYDHEWLKADYKPDSPTHPPTSGVFLVSSIQWSTRKTASNLVSYLLIVCQSSMIEWAHTFTLKLTF